MRILHNPIQSRAFAECLVFIGYVFFGVVSLNSKLQLRQGFPYVNWDVANVLWESGLLVRGDIDLEAHHGSQPHCKRGCQRLL
jgi:hypothetical protein